MDIIAKDKYDVVAITETHLSHEIVDSLVEIEGFTVFRKDRNRKGGGVVIYCRSELNTKLADYSKDSIGTFEFTFPLPALGALDCWNQCIFISTSHLPYVGVVGKLPFPSLRWVRWIVGINVFLYQHPIFPMLELLEFYLSPPSVGCVGLLESMYFYINIPSSLCWSCWKITFPLPALGALDCWNQCIFISTSHLPYVGVVGKLPFPSLRWVRWIVGINVFLYQHPIFPMLELLENYLSPPCVGCVGLLESMYFYINIPSSLCWSCWKITFPLPALGALDCWNQCIFISTSHLPYVGVVGKLPFPSLRWVRWIVGINAFLYQHPIFPMLELLEVYLPLPALGALDCWNQCIFISTSHLPCVVVVGKLSSPPCVGCVGLLESMHSFISTSRLFYVGVVGNLPFPSLRWVRWIVGIKWGGDFQQVADQAQHPTSNVPTPTVGLDVDISKTAILHLTGMGALQILRI